MTQRDPQPGPDDPMSARIATIPADQTAQPRRVVAGGFRLRGAFSAFRHRNYRLFFAGQAPSLLGSWMQTVALGWLVYDLSNSEFTLGLVSFLNSVPLTMLTVFAGHVADRHDKRSILIVTQTSAMVLTLVLALLAWTGVIQIWQIGLLGFLVGVSNAFDLPTRQSFVVDMVGKDDLMNAIALNSSMFNGARVVGPAVGGFLIASIGAAGCILLNAISFLPAIGSYFLMRLPPRRARIDHQSLGVATAEGIRFCWQNRVIRAIMALVVAASLFGWPFIVLLPVFARDILGLGASGYGFLMASSGVGAFAGAIVLASLGDPPRKRPIVFTGVFGFSLMLLVFSRSTNVALSAAALAAAGFFMILFFATANTAVQLRTPDRLRGRVMGIYSFSFLGLTPVGSLLAGLIARATSAPLVVAVGAAVLLVIASLMLILTRSEPPASAE